MDNTLVKVLRSIFVKLNVDEKELFSREPEKRTNYREVGGYLDPNQL